MFSFDNKDISSGSWTIRFYPLNHSNRFTSYPFPATFCSLIASPFSYSSTPLPAVWKPGIPGHLIWRGTTPNRLFADYIYTCRNIGFLWSSFWKPHCHNLVWLPLYFVVVVVDPEDVKYQFSSCGRPAWIINLDPQASNYSKHKLLTGRKEGCLENNSFLPKVWTLGASSGWNESTAN